MKTIVAGVLLFGTIFTANGQLYIEGTISRSPEWAGVIYITRLDHIDLNFNNLVDSITLFPNGGFSYAFDSDSLDGLLYKMTIPPKGGSFRSVVGGAQENCFILTTEEKDSLVITANSDSLYYSLSIEGGKINRTLLD